MRISDWSSDVCSSDLHDLPGRRRPFHASLTEGRTMPQPFRNRVALVTGGASGIGQAIVRRLIADGARTVFTDIDETAGGRMEAEAGGAERKSVGKGQGVSVRVASGGGGIIKKKKE